MPRGMLTVRPERRDPTVPGVAPLLAPRLLQPRGRRRWWRSTGRQNRPQFSHPRPRPGPALLACSCLPYSRVARRCLEEPHIHRIRVRPALRSRMRGYECTVCVAERVPVACRVRGKVLPPAQVSRSFAGCSSSATKASSLSVHLLLVVSCSVYFFHIPLVEMRLSASNTAAPTALFLATLSTP